MIPDLEQAIKEYWSALDYARYPGHVPTAYAALQEAAKADGLIVCHVHRKNGTITFKTVRDKEARPIL